MSTASAPSHRTHADTRTAGRGAALDSGSAAGRNPRTMHTTTEPPDSHPRPSSPGRRRERDSFAGERPTAAIRLGAPRRTGSPNGCPQAVGNLRTHLPTPDSRRFGGHVHKRIPRTAGLSTVWTALRTPSPPSSTRPSRHAQIHNLWITSVHNLGTTGRRPVHHSSPGRPQPARPVIHVVEKPLTSEKDCSQPARPTPRSQPVGELPPQPQRAGGQRCPPAIPSRVPSPPLFERDALRRGARPPGRRGAGDRQPDRTGPQRERRGPRR